MTAALISAVQPKLLSPVSMLAPAARSACRHPVRPAIAASNIAVEPSGWVASLLAPAARKTSTQTLRPCIAAVSNPVLPSSSVASMQAPAARSALRQPAWPPAAAPISAVLPLVSAASAAGSCQQCLHTCCPTQACCVRKRCPAAVVSCFCVCTGCQQCLHAGDMVANCRRHQRCSALRQRCYPYCIDAGAAASSAWRQATSPRPAAKCAASSRGGEASLAMAGNWASPSSISPAGSSAAELSRPGSLAVAAATGAAGSHIRHTPACVQGRAGGRRRSVGGGSGRAAPWMRDQTAPLPHTTAPHLTADDSIDCFAGRVAAGTAGRGRLDATGSQGRWPDC
jgi:hypothetical protein